MREKLPTSQFNRIDTRGQSADGNAAAEPWGVRRVRMVSRVGVWYRILKW